MIKVATIINEPPSGKYIEKIYVILSCWNSQEWSWIKFTDDDYNEWCGEFRGKAKSVVVSPKNRSIIVLTSDYLYRLDIINGDLIEVEPQPQYENLTVSPTGKIVIADCYNIFICELTLHEKIMLDTPIKMDNIEFKDWKDGKLLIICEEFLNWNNSFELEFDDNLSEINIIKSY